jgi:hypothetical protein
MIEYILISRIRIHKRRSERRQIYADLERIKQTILTTPLPITIDDKYNLIAGWMRYRAYLESGITYVPIIRCDMPDEWVPRDNEQCENCKQIKHTTLEMIGPTTVRTCLDCQKIAPANRQRVEVIDIEMIRIRPSQKDRRASFSAGTISAQEHQYTQPLILDQEYYLVDGWMRYQACKAAGIKLVAIIRR